MKIQQLSYTLSQLPSIVAMLNDLKKSCQIYTFTGHLGAGKTTLVSALLHSWGVQEAITSPTFAYVNTYRLKNGTIIYHFDLYRIDNVATFYALGFDEYLYKPNSWAFIEWPHGIASLLDHAVCHVTLEYGVQEDERIVDIRVIP